MTQSSPRGALDLSPNALTVLEKRYLVKDDAGKPVESSEDLFWRVARTIAGADKKYGASSGAIEELARIATIATCPAAVFNSSLTICPSDFPSRRIEANRITKSCTAPPNTTPMRIQSVPGK